MSKLTRNNLQLFCRTCLSALQPVVETIYNIYLVPNLTKLLIISTSLDANEDNDLYPKNLCQLCYDKLQDFQSFRCMAQQSAEMLNSIINSKDDLNFSGSDPTLSMEKDSKCRPNSIEINYSQRNNDNLEMADDDQLLLPELSMGSFFEKQIKTEAIDIESQEIQINHTTPEWCSNHVEVKNELDIDYDENSTFFESKSFNSSFQSTSDDCDDKKNESSNFQMFDQEKDIFSSGKKNHCKRKLSKEFIQQYSEDNDMEHICQQCGKKFSTKYALINHLKRHANFKEHVCEICGVGKITRTELQIHMRSHQPNAEKFKCNLCPQEFKYKNAIQRHVRAVHEGLRPYACSYCPKNFGTQSSRKSHERLHTGERPFSCEICHRSFVQSECLRSHMKNHDKSLRTHVCRYCSQRFITRKNLIDHEERHRGDKPHICKICNRGFFTKDDLISHHKLHQNSKNSKQNGGCNETQKCVSVREASSQGNIECAEGYSESFPEKEDSAVMDRKSPSVLNKSGNLETSMDVLDINSVQKYNNLVSTNSSAAPYQKGMELNKSSNSSANTCFVQPHQELEERPLSPYVSCGVELNQLDSKT